MNDELFIDTGYAIALSSKNDKYHKGALYLADKIAQTGSLLVTTRAIQLEIGNALSKLRYRQAAIKLLDSLEADPAVTIIPLADALYAKAFELYRERDDKEWGLVDCMSFIVMKQRGITEALTADNHFRQAGFRALLKEIAS